MMKLGMFYWPCGHHIAGWRHPDGRPDCGSNIEHLIQVAQLAERGLFDMFFMADSVTFWRGELDAMSHDSWGTSIEPFTLMCSLAQHTKNIGLVCTSTTTYDQPYALARRFASLDLASGGRAGWNLVTSANASEADSFGFDQHMPKVDRYKRGREFADVVRGLWNSWEDDAFTRDADTGIYFDTERVNILQHDGPFFRVKGPLNVSPSPQGEPVLVQAGASEEGRALAAETAEVVFGAHMTLESAQEYYADVKGRMPSYGRDPDNLKIMPGLFICTAPTQAEAEDKYEFLQDLIDPVTGLQLLSKRLDYDLRGQDVDGPLPEIPRNNVTSSRVDLILDLAKRENLTIKDLYRRIAGARGHYTFVGAATDAADMMEEWVTEKGCDGFNVMPSVFPTGLSDIIELVIPELQRRGLYRTAYEGNTLRENLGVTRPAWSAPATARSITA